MQMLTEERSFLVIKVAKELNEGVLSGDVEIDIENNYVISNLVEEELRKGKNNFMIDLTNVRYIDSSGFNALLESYKDVMENGGILKVFNANDHIKRVLNILKVEL